LIDFTKSAKGITREVAKEDQGKLGQNEEAERRRREQVARGRHGRRQN
jgi:hypothetical protein